MKHVVVLFTLIMCLSGMCDAAPAVDNQSPRQASADMDSVLGTLQQKLSGIETLRTDFVQEKRLQVLNEKIVLKGTVALKKPSLLAWHVREPMRYSMVMDGDIIRQWDEDSKKVQEISLAKNLTFQAAIAQMKEWFSGNYKSLEGDYSVMMRAQDPVTLEFTPREDSLASSVINRVTVEFMADKRYIHQIRVDEKSGDSMLLTFVDTQLNMPIDASLWEVQPRVR